jgi:hypothetical protein
MTEGGVGPLQPKKPTPPKQSPIQDKSVLRLKIKNKWKEML